MINKKMGGINCHFCTGACEDMSIQNLFCCPSKPTEENKLDALVYVTAQGPQQFVLINTPFIEVKDWIVWDSIPFNTVTVFFKDADDKLRALLHHQPHEIIHRMSPHRSSSALPTSVELKDETKVPTPTGSCEMSEGQLVDDLLPPHLKAPITRFMLDTLEGTWFQMCGLFNSAAKLIRTFPITDYNNHIVAGIMIIGPVSPQFEDKMQQCNPGPRSPRTVAMSENTEVSDIPEFPSTKHLGRKQTSRRRSKK